MHVSRWGLVVAVACVAITGGCSDDPAPSDSPDDGQAANAVDGEASDGADEFAVTVTGQPVPMNARAELRVNEGERDVHLSITGRTPGTDVIVIDLTFDGLENTFGEHTVQFSLPEGGPHDANGSLGGAWYYSQSGQAVIALTTEGRLEGHLEIALARADETQSGPFEFKSSEDSTPLAITFSVPWVLSCHSRLAGHGILQLGGDYCDDLAL